VTFILVSRLVFLFLTTTTTPRIPAQTKA